MRLVDVSTDEDISSPSSEQVVEAVKAVYDDYSQAIILIANTEENLFMQTHTGTREVEYCVGLTGPIYSSQDTSVEVAIDMFLSYLAGGDKWQKMATWRVAVERIG